MRCTARVLSVPRLLSSKIDEYAIYAPTPLNIKSFLDFGNQATPTKAFGFLRHEFPIRLAHIMKEINLLPDALTSTDSVQQVVDLYLQSFADIIEFENSSTKSTIVQHFTELLHTIKTRHTPVVQLMAQGITEMRSSQQISPIEQRQLQYFLDRFYTSRIGIRMLISQQVNLFAGDLFDMNTRLVGCIDPQCTPLNVACEAYLSASNLWRQVYGRSPGLHIHMHGNHGHRDAPAPNSARPASEHPWVWFKKPGLDSITVSSNRLSSDIEFPYVTDHLFSILLELFKNSIRATITSVPEQQDLPDLKLLINEGQEDIVIRLEDRGSGMSRAMMGRVFQYTFSTCERPLIVSLASSTRREAKTMAVAGYGHGLPLSRLHARYLSGELYFYSLEGQGSVAVVYMKKNPADANEVLPIFNRTAERAYKQPNHSFLSDWTNTLRSPQSS